MKFGIEDAVLMKINKILSEYPSIQQGILFGSRAKGNFKSSSDIDLALMGQTININILNQVSIRLDDLLLPVIFDLTILNHINNPDLLEHIRRVGIVLYDAGKP